MTLKSCFSGFRLVLQCLKLGPDWRNYCQDAASSANLSKLWYNSGGYYGQFVNDC